MHWSFWSILLAFCINNDASFHSRQYFIPLSSWLWKCSPQITNHTILNYGMSLQYNCDTYRVSILLNLQHNIKSINIGQKIYIWYMASSQWVTWHVITTSHIMVIQYQTAHILLNCYTIFVLRNSPAPVVSFWCNNGQQCNPHISRRVYKYFLRVICIYIYTSESWLGNVIIVHIIT